MSLTPGERLGPYQILVLVGRAGMGELYSSTRVRRFTFLRPAQSRSVGPLT